jgi:hypothetical protein
VPGTSLATTDVGTHYLNFKAITAEAGGWVRIRAVAASSAASDLRIGLSSTGTTFGNYVGNGSSLIVYAPVYAIQRKIATQTDHSGTGHHRVQASDASRPTVLTDPATGLMVVGSFGPNLKSAASNAAVPTALSGTDQPFTWVCYGKFTQLTAEAIGTLSAAGSTALQQAYRRSTSALQVARTDDAATAKTGDLTGTAHTDYESVAVVFDGQDLRVRRDGVDDATVTDLDVGACTFTSVTRSFKAAIERESALYSAALNNTQLDAILAGMAARAA